jgi:medium-chain acyl-[acyl-carrier-protein] hydrolase
MGTKGVPGLPQVPVVPVRLPGREQRIGEAQHTALDSLIDAMVTALDGILARPFALFGHSLGAVIAFELARRGRELIGNEPVRLFVSGQPAPGPGTRPRRRSGLPDDELIAYLDQLGGLPAAARDHEELLALLLPRVRADLAMHEGYRYSPGRKLSCPISAFGGLADSWVASEELESWTAHTTGRMTLRLFGGGHFFHLEHQHGMLAAIADDLRGDLPGHQPGQEAQ